MGMRPAIDIYHCRIFLAGIKVVGFHHTIKQVCHTVGGLDGTIGKDWLTVIFPRILGIQQFCLSAVAGIDNIDDARTIGGRELQENLLA